MIKLPIDKDIDLIVGYLNTKRFDKRRFHALIHRYRPDIGLELEDILEEFDLEIAKHFHPFYLEFFDSLPPRGKIKYKALNYIISTQLSGRMNVPLFAEAFEDGPPQFTPIFKYENPMDLVHQSLFILVVNWWERMSQTIRKCEHEKCDIFFRAKKAKAKFCSDRCRWADNYRRGRKAS